MNDDEDQLFYLGLGPMAAILLGGALTPLRGVTVASNFTFAFLALTIAVGEFGGRVPALATALVSALSLDFFLTRPYMRLAIHDKNDLVAFLGLAACGLLAAFLGSPRRERDAARKRLLLVDRALRPRRRRPSRRPREPSGGLRHEGRGRARARRCRQLVHRGRGRALGLARPQPSAAKGGASGCPDRRIAAGGDAGRLGQRPVGRAGCAPDPWRSRHGPRRHARRGTARARRAEPRAARVERRTPPHGALTTTGPT
jgi:hypothetical protein